MTASYLALLERKIGRAVAEANVAERDCWVQRLTEVKRLRMPTIPGPWQKQNPLEQIERKIGQAYISGQPWNVRFWIEERMWLKRRR